MKKYYIHDGKDQLGPFDISELHEKGISADTPIWHEGLPEWGKAREIEEVREALRLAVPPPFQATSAVPPAIQEASAQQVSADPPSGKRHSAGRRFLKATAIFGLIVFVLLILNEISSDGSGDAATNRSDSYEEKVMTVEEIERSRPTDFLTADGEYRENIWGNKLKVQGVIRNNATVASYKDAVVRVTYFSKTKTELSSEKYTIYEAFPPNSEVKFELTLENFNEVHSIGWTVVNATPI